MPKIKKSNNFLRGLKTSFFAMETVSKRILRCGSAAVILTYACALIVAAIGDAAFPDLTTALFWSGELLTLGKELLGAVFVPVLLFELLLIVRGHKK